MDSTWIIWLVLLIGTLVLEAVTLQYFSVWFALGALAAIAACLLGAEVWLQIVVFTAVTVISLLATRPFVRRMQSRKIEPTNADRFVGQPAVVLEEIDNLGGKGLIKVGGQIWSARAVEGDTVIPAGESVRTVSIQGSKMLVAADAQDQVSE